MVSVSTLLLILETLNFSDAAGLERPLSSVLLDRACADTRSIQISNVQIFFMKYSFRAGLTCGCDYLSSLFVPKASRLTLASSFIFGYIYPITTNLETFSCSCAAMSKYVLLNPPLPSQAPLVIQEQLRQHFFSPPLSRDFIDTLPGSARA